MFKINPLLSVIIPFALICSCAKKEQPTPPEPEPETHEFSILASTDEYSPLRWDGSDSINVFCGNRSFGLGNKSATLAKSATFSVKTDAETPSPYIALFPYDAAATYQNEVLTTSLPVNQYARPDYYSKCNSLFAGGSDNTGIRFQDLCGGIDFTLTRGDVYKVTLKSDTPIAGKINAMMFGDEFSVCDILEDCDSISIMPADGKVFEAGRTYHISVLPTICFNGYSIKIDTETSEASMKVSGQKTFTAGESVQYVEMDKNLAFYPKTQPEVAPDFPGKNVKGIVWDATDHKGIPGVVVSDGVQCTVTDKFGMYHLASDMAVAKNVFVVMPSEYELTFSSKGTWNNFIRLNKAAAVNNCDFFLTPRKEGSDNFKMLMMGDPQQMSSRPHSAESWNYVTTNLNKYKSTVTGNLYEMFLGDMVTNEIEVAGKADAYLATLKKSGIGSFHVPGNHDHVQSAKNYYDSIIYYSDYFGPYNYAFNLGKVHFIGLDSCDWSTGSLVETLNSAALSFLESDLKYVPEDRIIMICTHCPLTKKHGGSIPSPACRSKMFQILKGRTVHFWYGHIHFGVNFSYTSNELKLYAPGVRSLDSHVVSRCGGAWCCSGEVCRDGTPRGFVEVEANGYDVKWHFHSFDPNYDHDCNVYKPGQFIPDNLSFADNKALYVNIYMWDNAWGTPEWWVNGAKVGAMTKVTDDGYDATYDPLYGHFYPIWAKMGIVGFRTNENPKAYDNSHLFKIVPAEGVKSGEIRYTDRWGKEHKVSVQL